MGAGHGMETHACMARVEAGTATQHSMIAGSTSISGGGDIADGLALLFLACEPGGRQGIYSTTLPVVCHSIYLYSYGERANELYIVLALAQQTPCPRTRRVGFTCSR